MELAASIEPLVTPKLWPRMFWPRYGVAHHTLCGVRRPDNYFSIPNGLLPRRQAATRAPLHDGARSDISGRQWV